MKKKVISYNQALANKEMNEAKRKIGLFNNAVSLVSQHVPVTDLKRFSESFTKYLYDELQKKSNGVLSNIGHSQVMQLHEINDELIRKTENEYKALRVQLTPDFKDYVRSDYNVYAETPEEVAKVKQFELIQSMVEECKKAGINVHYGNLSRAFWPLTAIDGMKLTANIGYIKNQQLHP